MVESALELIQRYLGEMPLNKDNVVFRGEPKDYKATKYCPSTVRNKNANSKDIHEEWNAILEWNNRCREIGLNSHIRNDWELLFEAQHYGLPTRLLDWTTNPLFALWMACGGYEQITENSSKSNCMAKDGHVYYLDVPYSPIKIGQRGQSITADGKNWCMPSGVRDYYHNPIYKSLNGGEVTYELRQHYDLRFQEFGVSSSDCAYMILFVKPESNINRRLQAQSGLFSIHNGEHAKFGNKMDKKKYKIKSFVVAKELKVELLDILEKLNFTAATLGFLSNEIIATRVREKFEGQIGGTNR